MNTKLNTYEVYTSESFSPLGQITCNETEEIISLIENGYLIPEDIAFLSTLKKKDMTLILNDDRPAFSLVPVL